MNHWVECKLKDTIDILDNLRKPINSKERQKRIDGKSVSELYSYYGATGQVGYIDTFITNGEFVLLGEDAAPFFDYTKDTAYLIKGKTWVNNHAHILRSYFNNSFLCFYLNQFDFNGFVSGTTRLKLTQGALRQIPFKRPPLPEQRAIVAKIEQLFSDLDNGIANLQQAQAQLKVYRQAVLKKAFEGELTKAWREQQTDLPSADELLKQIKTERETHYAEQLATWQRKISNWEANGKPSKKPAKPKKQKELPPLTKKELTELPTLPDGWFFTYLANSGDLARGKSKHRPRKDKKLFGGDYPFIQTGEVKSANIIITDYSKTYNNFGLSQSKIWTKGTLCITIAANIAETAFLGFDACFPDSIVGFVAYLKVINKKYINYFFHASKQKITAFAPATAQKNINLTTLENLLIPYASLKEQTQIVLEIESRLSVCDNVETIIKNSLQQAEALRQSILEKAFEGKLLSDSELTACRAEPDWEPAAKLLKRIKAEKAKHSSQSKK